MAATTSTLAFDHFVISEQRRSLYRQHVHGASSSTTASTVDSLPPPPRPRKTSTPTPSPSTAVVTRPASLLVKMQQPPVLRDPFTSSSTSPITKSAAAATEATTQRMQSPGERTSEESKVDLYQESLSSLSQYKELFYRPPVDSTYAIGPKSQQSLDLTDTTSIEDYSDLLYPELQTRRARDTDSINSYGPPVRKRIPSFSSSLDVPQSPVEFANLSTPMSAVFASPISDERRPSKIERLLGLEAAGSRHGSTDMLLPKESTRRESFIEFDSAPQVLAKLGHVRSDSQASDAIPSFKVPKARAIGSISSVSGAPQPKLGEYIALVDTVDSIRQTHETTSRSKSQFLVDGSDKAISPSPSPLPSSINTVDSDDVIGRPSTSNLLEKDERAELVRKNKKIAQVLGPGAVPAAQDQFRPTPPGSQSDSNGKKDTHHRNAKSEAVGIDSPEWEASHQQKLKDASRRMERQSSWSALDHDTIFLTGTGKRQMTPLGPNESGPEAIVGLDANWDAASMSSLGSIIKSGGILDQKDSFERRDSLETMGSRKSGRRSPTSFMEMSDDDGMNTPKRRSVDGAAKGKNVERIASPSLKINIERADSPEPRSSYETATTSISISKRRMSENFTRSRSDTIRTTETYATANSGRTKGSGSGSGRTKGSAASYLSLSDDEIDRHDWIGDPKSDAWRADRQRKREKLAKIHRYLGSKVPAELVLGYSSATSSLPPTASTINVSNPSPVQGRHLSVDDGGPKRGGKENYLAGDGIHSWKRRRSSSAAVYSYSQGRGMVKENDFKSKDTMTDSERLREVKRAQKIEQIFGEQPPKRFSITRPATAPEVAQVSHTSPNRPKRRREGSTTSIERPSSSKGKVPKSPGSAKDGRPSTSGSTRSTARSTTGLIVSYNKEREREKKAATGMAEDDINFAQTIEISAAYYPVGTALGSPWEDLYDSDVLDISPAATIMQNSGRSPIMPGVRTSRQFLDYRNSLNTLGRILDQDDRQSLNELHAVLDSDEDGEYTPVDRQHLIAPGSLHNPAPVDSQRTLQPRASLSSINTVATNTSLQTLTPEPMGFQARRKRAAKLTHFFGATYRDLFGEVLDRIERGMLEEARQGVMSQEEMRHLMKQLDRLKRRQSQLS